MDPNSEDNGRENPSFLPSQNKIPLISERVRNKEIEREREERKVYLFRPYQRKNRTGGTATPAEPPVESWKRIENTVWTDSSRQVGEK